MWILTTTSGQNHNLFSTCALPAGLPSIIHQGSYLSPPCTMHNACHTNDDDNHMSAYGWQGLNILTLLLMPQYLRQFEKRVNKQTTWAEEVGDCDTRVGTRLALEPTSGTGACRSPLAIGACHEGHLRLFAIWQSRLSPATAVLCLCFLRGREGGSGDELSHNLPTWTLHCTAVQLKRRTLGTLVLPVEHSFSFSAFNSMGNIVIHFLKESPGQMPK